MKTDILWTWENWSLQIESAQEGSNNLPFPYHSISLYYAPSCIRCNFSAITIKFYSPQSGREKRFIVRLLLLYLETPINFPVQSFDAKNVFKNPRIRLSFMIFLHWKFDTKKQFARGTGRFKWPWCCCDLVNNGCRPWPKKIPGRWKMTVDLFPDICCVSAGILFCQKILKILRRLLRFSKLLFYQKIMQISLERILLGCRMFLLLLNHL